MISTRSIARVALPLAVVAGLGLSGVAAQPAADFFAPARALAESADSPADGAAVTSNALTAAVSNSIERAANGGTASGATETAGPAAAAAQIDWDAQLDSMSIDELKDLDTKVHNRMTHLSASQAGKEEGAEISAAGDVQNESQLVVVNSFVYDRDVYVIVRNDSDQAILNFDVAYTTFDQNGLPASTKRDQYERGTAKAANVMPGQTAMFSWRCSEGVYPEVTVSSVEYRDGSVWENEQVDEWAADARATFTVADYQAGIESLAENAGLATAEEPVALHDLMLTERNQFSTSKDLDFTIGNYSEFGLTDATIFTLQYDVNGYPVNVSPYDTFSINGRRTGGNLNVGPWSWESFTSTLFAESSTESIIGCVESVTYSDGSTWENPYFYDWLVYHVVRGSAF